MSSKLDIEALIQMGNDSKKALDVHMKTLDAIMDNAIRNIEKDNDKVKVEKLKALTQDVIASAKKGDMSKVDELIKSFENGR